MGKTRLLVVGRSAALKDKKLRAFLKALKKKKVAIDEWSRPKKLRKDYKLVVVADIDKLPLAPPVWNDCLAMLSEKHRLILLSDRPVSSEDKSLLNPQIIYSTDQDWNVDFIFSDESELPAELSDDDDLDEYEIDSNFKLKAPKTNVAALLSPEEQIAELKIEAEDSLQLSVEDEVLPIFEEEASEENEIDLAVSENAFEENQEGLGVDAHEEVLGLDDSEEVLSLDDSEEVLGLDDSEEVLSLDDSEEVLSLDDSEEVLSLDDSEEVLGLDDSEEVLSLDDGEEVLSLDDSEDELVLGFSEEEENLADEGQEQAPQSEEVLDLEDEEADDFGVSQEIPVGEFSEDLMAQAEIDMSKLSHVEEEVVVDHSEEFASLQTGDLIFGDNSSSEEKVELKASDIKEEAIGNEEENISEEAMLLGEEAFESMQESALAEDIKPLQFDEADSVDSAAAKGVGALLGGALSMFSAKNDNSSDESIFEEEVVAAVKPKKKDVDTIKKYAEYRERESEEKDAIIQALRQQLDKLRDVYKESEGQRRSYEMRIHDLESEKRNLEDIRDQHKHHVEQLEKKHSHNVRDLQIQLDNAQFQSSRSEKKLDDFRERVRVDILKIRTRERELYNKLELQKRDAEALLSSKDNRILEYKREIDRLEFELENLNERLLEETQRAEERAARLNRAIQSLKMAQGMLSGMEEEVLPGLDTDDDDRNAA